MLNAPWHIFLIWPVLQYISLISSDMHSCYYLHCCLRKSIRPPLSRSNIARVIFLFVVERVNEGMEWFSHPEYGRKWFRNQHFVGGCALLIPFVRCCFKHRVPGCNLSQHTNIIGQCFPNYFSSRPSFHASFIVRPTLRCNQTNEIYQKRNTCIFM